MTESPPAPPPPTASGNPGTEVPPLTAFAWRHRLVRPVQGRTFAGVCGAFARATNTDVVLWRVIIVVLSLFVGVGLLIYLLGWLLLPADGDTATPVEALAGRGQSRTSTIRTIVGIVVGIILLAGYLSEPWRVTPVLVAALLGGVLLLLLRDQRAGSAPNPAVPSPPGAPPTPFAPHGPFAPPPTVRPVLLAPPVAAWRPEPAPRPPASRLGQLTLSMAVLALGALFAIDLVGYSVTGLAYIAAPLAVLGLGLLVGTWIGRSRWLIPLGIVLVLALGGGAAALEDGRWRRPHIGGVSFSPTSVADIDDSYRQHVGDLSLDLSAVDFSGQSVQVRVEVDLGNLRVELPSDVDVTVDATVDAGNADVLDESWNGLGSESRTVTDLGADGAGGGRLHITAIVNLGNLEVNR